MCFVRKGKNMLQRIRDLKQQEGGFTLIELLIVIVILGILAAIVVFSVAGISDRGTKAACQADKKSVEVATEAFYAKNAAYPANVTALTVAPDIFLHSVPSTVHYTISTAAGVVGVAAGTTDGPPAGC